MTTVSSPDCRRRGRALARITGAVLWLLAGSFPAWADQIEMQNGDRNAGDVLSLNAHTVVMQSDVLGTVRLARTNVAVITLGTAPAINSPALQSPTNGHAPAAAAVPATAPRILSPRLRQLGASTNLIQQVQKQFLGDAGPEANTKFNELLSGLMSGKVSVEDIRAQAKSAADQLRALRREGGEETGFAVDTYLAILDHFVKETAPAAPAAKSPTPAPQPKAKPAPPEE
jgi:hypothetical protein